MPNVDFATRLLNKACSDEYAQLSIAKRREIAINFFSIPKNEKPNFFKNLSQDETIDFFKSINSKLRIKFAQHFKKRVLKIECASNSNFVGADLKVTLQGRIVKQIELKFGQETLKAIGLKTFDQIFVVSNKSNYFKNVLNTVRNNQIDFAKHNQGKVDELVENLRRQFAPLVNQFKELLYNGKIVINSEEMLKQLGGTGSATMNVGANQPTKFIVSPRDIQYVESLNLTGNWKIKSILLSENDGKARISFNVENDFTTAKFLVHWKNDKVLDGHKYPSKTGVNTYCFNVWASKKGGENE